METRGRKRKRLVPLRKRDILNTEHSGRALYFLHVDVSAAHLRKLQEHPPSSGPSKNRDKAN